LAFSVGVGAPVAAVGGGALAVGGAAFASTALLEGGAAYREARRHGASDEEAERALFITGLANGVLDATPIGRFLSRTPLGRQSLSRIRNRIARQTVEIGKRGGEQAGFEAGTESVQTVVSNAVQMEFDENRALLDDTAEAAFFGGVLGGGMSFAGDVVSSGARGVFPSAPRGGLNEGINFELNETLEDTREGATARVPRGTDLFGLYNDEAATHNALGRGFVFSDHSDDTDTDGVRTQTSRDITVYKPSNDERVKVLNGATPDVRTENARALLRETGADALAFPDFGGQNKLVFQNSDALDSLPRKRINTRAIRDDVTNQIQRDIDQSQTQDEFVRTREIEETFTAEGNRTAFTEENTVPVEPVSPELQPLVNNVDVLKVGVVRDNQNGLLVGRVSPNVSKAAARIRDLDIVLNRDNVQNINQKHGAVPSENLVLTINKPDHVVFFPNAGKGNRDMINFVRELPGGENIIVGAIRVNGFAIVTAYETSRQNLSSLVNKEGAQLVYTDMQNPDQLNVGRDKIATEPSGGTAAPSLITPSEVSEQRAVVALSAVRELDDSSITDVKELSREALRNVYRRGAPQDVTSATQRRVEQIAEYERSTIEERYQRIPADLAVNFDDSTPFISNQEAERVVRQFFDPDEVGVAFVSNIRTPEGAEAFGRYSNKMIEFVNNPHQTTPFHESVHAYLNLFVDVQRKRKILDEVRRKKRKPNWTDEQAEEQLADDFIRYIRRERKPQNLIGELFRRVKRFLQRLHPASAERLFQDIISRRRPMGVQVRTFTEDIQQVRRDFYQQPGQFTTKLFQLPDMQDRETVSQEFLRNTLRSKKSNLKGREQSFVEYVLDTHFQNTNKINTQELQERISEELLPVSLQETDNFAKYGITNPAFLGEDYAETFTIDERAEAKTFLIDTGYRYIDLPWHKATGVGHFRAAEVPGLLGHFRMAVMNVQGKRIAKVLEIQSDPIQDEKMERMTADDMMNYLRTKRDEQSEAIDTHLRKINSLREIESTYGRIVEKVRTRYQEDQDADKRLDTDLVNEILAEVAYLETIQLTTDDVPLPAADAVNRPLVEAIEDILDLLQLHHPQLREYRANGRVTLSDTLQNQIGDVRISWLEERMTSFGARAAEKASTIDNGIVDQKNRLQEWEDLVSYYENNPDELAKWDSLNQQWMKLSGRWHELAIKFAIQQAAMKGAEEVHFPTAFTVSRAENWDGQGDPEEGFGGEYDDADVQFGNTIDADGREWTIIEVNDDNSFRAVAALDVEEIYTLSEVRNGLFIDAVTEFDSSIDAVNEFYDNIMQGFENDPDGSVNEVKDILRSQYQKLVQDERNEIGKLEEAIERSKRQISGIRNGDVTFIPEVISRKYGAAYDSFMDLKRNASFLDPLPETEGRPSERVTQRMRDLKFDIAQRIDQQVQVPDSIAREAQSDERRDLAVRRHLNADVAVFTNKEEADRFYNGLRESFERRRQQVEKRKQYVDETGTELTEEERNEQKQEIDFEAALFNVIEPEQHDWYKGATFQQNAEEGGAYYVFYTVPDTAGTGRNRESAEVPAPEELVPTFVSAEETDIQKRQDAIQRAQNKIEIHQSNKEAINSMEYDSDTGLLRLHPPSEDGMQKDRTVDIDMTDENEIAESQYLREYIWEKAQEAAEEIDSNTAEWLVEQRHAAIVYQGENGLGETNLVAVSSSEADFNDFPPPAEAGARSDINEQRQEFERTTNLKDPELPFPALRTRGDFNPQKAALFYEVAHRKFLQKLRKGNYEEIVDHTGYSWRKTEITPEDKGAIEYFQSHVPDDIDPRNRAERVEQAYRDAERSVISELSQTTFTQETAEVQEQLGVDREASALYPEWLPSALRNRGLIDRVLQKIDNGEQMSGDRQQRLYDLIQNKVIERMNTQQVNEQVISELQKRSQLREEVQRIMLREDTLERYKQMIPQGRTRGAETKKVVRQVTGQVRNLRDFNERMRALARGYREGTRYGRNVVKQVQREALSVIEELPAEEQGKFRRTIVNIQTPEHLEKKLPQIQERIERIVDQRRKRGLKKQIRKELKNIKPKRDRTGLVRGRFTADTQNKLQLIKDALEGDRQEALQQLEQKVEQEAQKDSKIFTQSDIEQMEMLQMTGMKDMTAEQLEFTLKNIRNLKETGRTLRELQDFNKQEELDRLRQTFIDRVTGGKGVAKDMQGLPRREKGAATLLENYAPGFKTWVDAHRGIEFVFEYISRFDSASEPLQTPFHTTLMRRIRDARDDQNSTLTEWEKTWHSAFANFYDLELYGRDYRKAIKQQAQEVDLGITPKGADRTLKMNRFELRKKWMEMQDESLIPTFENMGWDESVRQAVDAAMTDADKRFAEWQLKEFYPRYRAHINPTYRYFYGVDMGNIENYSPIKRSGGGEDVPQHVQLAQDILRKSSTKAGSLVSRVSNVKPLEFVGDMQMMTQHLTEMEHFRAYSEVVSDMRRIFDGDLMEAIKQNHGNATAKQINKLIDDLARDGIDASHRYEFLDKARSWFAVGVLGADPVATLKQLTSFPVYLTEMDTSTFFGGIRDFWMNDMREKARILLDTEFMRSRYSMGEFDRDIKIAFDQGSSNKRMAGLEGFRQMVMGNIRLGDTGAILPGGWAKYKQEFERQLGQSLPSDAASIRQLIEDNPQAHREAVNAFRNTTLRTQQAGNVEDLGDIQRAGSFGNLFTLFMTTPLQYWRIEENAFRNLGALEKMGGSVQRGKVSDNLKVIAIMHVIIPSLFQLVADGFEWQEDRQLRAALLGSFGYPLIFGNMLDTMARVATGDDVFSDNLMPSGISQWADFMDVGKNVYSTLDDFFNATVDVEPERLWDTITEAVSVGGQVTGLPTEQIVTTTKGAYELAQGRTQDPRVLFWSDYGLDRGGEFEMANAERVLTEQERRQFDAQVADALEDGRIDVEKAKRLRNKIQRNQADIKARQYWEQTRGLPRTERLRRYNQLSNDVKDAVRDIADEEAIKDAREWWQQTRELPKQERVASFKNQNPAVREKIRAIAEREREEERLLEKLGARPHDEETFLQNVSDHLKAVQTDPIQAARLLFNGERIRRVDSGAIIVERMPFAASQRIRRERNASDEVELDHIIPLQLGGTNDVDNLRLVDKEQHEEYTQIGNMLGEMLRDGQIEADRAQELIRDYKMGDMSREQIMNEIAEVSAQVEQD
jgi:hypothetical protein